MQLAASVSADNQWLFSTHLIYYTSLHCINAYFFAEIGNLEDRFSFMTSDHWLFARSLDNRCSVYIPSFHATVALYVNMVLHCRLESLDS